MATGKYIALLCNRLAGNGKAVQLTEKISADLRKKNIEFICYTSDWPQQLDPFTDVFIIGGDGTLNYFVNHYHETKTPVAIFNGGTGNDFHWLLYGDQSLEQQLALVLSTPPRPIDIGRCNERYFINGLGIGFDGEVARSLTGKKKAIGKKAFLIAILKKIFFYRSQSYKIQSAEKQESARKLLIGVANGRRAGGGFHIAPESLADDGWLDVVTIQALSPLKRLRYLPVIEKGKHLSLPFIDYFKTKKICVESNELMHAHLDGEYYSCTKMEIEILPAKLKFLY